MAKKKKSILKKFNWAAFIFCPIWAVAHEVKEGYLGFIPGFWTIIGLYLGCCGNELAYESQNWRYTCEKDFEEREKKWNRVVYILFLSIFMIFLSFKLKDAYNVYRNGKIYEENYQRGLDLKQEAIDQTNKLLQSDAFKEKRELVYEFEGETYTYNMDPQKDEITPIIENYEDYPYYKDKSFSEKSKLKLSSDLFIEKTTIIINVKEDAIYDILFGDSDDNVVDNVFYLNFHFENNKLSYVELTRLYIENGKEIKDEVTELISKEEVKKIFK